MTAFSIDKSKPLDLICMGRAGIDLYAEQLHQPLSKVKSFRKYLGGSPANVSVGASRLGLNTALFSCVGADEMGAFLRDTLVAERVNTDLLYESPDHLTALVFLAIQPPHDFPLMFYRNQCADMQLKPSQAVHPLFAQTKMLHFTGTGISTAAMREVTLKTLQQAKSLGTKIVFDLDYRPVLWGLTPLAEGSQRYVENAEVTAFYQQFLPYCDLIAGTAEELMIAGGNADPNEAINALTRLTDAAVVYKKGLQGSAVYLDNGSQIIAQETWPVDVLNTLGAGDAFLSALIYALLRKKSWKEALSAANAAGAIVSSRHGCAPAMPTEQELFYFLSNYPETGKQVMAQLNASDKDINPHPLIQQKAAFADGVTAIVKAEDAYQTGMNFSVIKLRQGERFELTSPLETAALLMTGEIRFDYGRQSATLKRYSCFNETPFVLHAPADYPSRVLALSDCEILLMQTANAAQFEAKLFDGENMLENEHRGQGLLEDVSYRIVRTVFDKRNRPESNLVVGEIITFQGHWSSCPPHSHLQPEIYHYRFSEPQGFAFAEDGEAALKVRHNDTLVIGNEKTHAHAVLPGYALYTLWFIRHLDNNPYITPSFQVAHEWTRQPSANQRAWGISKR